MASPEIRRIAHGSPEYQAMIELRLEVLRRPLGLEFTAEDLQSESADTFLGVLSEGRAQACLVLTPRSETDVQMRQVAVAPELQRAGLGTRLVTESERVAAGMGFQTMVVSARAPAVLFYLRLGYTLVGEPYKEVGIEHRRLEKSLGNPLPLGERAG